LYQQSLKPEEQFELIIEDCYYESITGGVELVDFAVGSSVNWINLRGFMRPERTQKVARLQEILEEVRINAATVNNTNTQ
jgi:enolase